MTKQEAQKLLDRTKAIVDRKLEVAMRASDLHSKLSELVGKHADTTLDPYTVTLVRRLITLLHG